MIVGEYTQCGFPVEELTKGSSRKVLRKCDNVEHEGNDKLLEWTSYQNLCRNRYSGKFSDGKDYCNKCASKMKNLLRWKNMTEEEMKIRDLKREKTNLQRYGHKSSFQNSDVREKYKQTCMEKYGVENTLLIPEVRGKIKKTVKRKYGVDCVLDLDINREKAKLSKLGKSRSNEVKEKISKAHKGKKLSDETKRRISVSCAGENHPFYGKKHTEESKRKMSLSSAGSRSPNWKEDRILIESFVEFKKEVHRYSNSNYKRFRSIIDPSCLRGRSYHLDHKFSICEAFYGMSVKDPRIVAHVFNLQILDHKENMKKKTDSSITFDELMSYSNLFPIIY